MRNATHLARRRLARHLLPALLLLPAPAGASPLEFLPVGDPLETEIRTLDILGPIPGSRPMRLPRTGMRPLQRFEMDSLPAPESAAGTPHQLSLLRLRRALARDRNGDLGTAPEGYAPRLYQKHFPDGARFELSVAAEGMTDMVTQRRARYRSDTGIHGRVALETDRWLAYSHLVIGHQDSARTFADPIAHGTDIIAHTTETYFAYTGGERRWGVQFGRSRWHWGPGEEGSMLLSKSAAAITGIALHARVEALRADGMALSATLASDGGEQLAAHRLEWQPYDNLRIGLSEAARYQAEAWQPLYVLGAIPYILVQRLLDQDEPGARAAHRNNILVGADVAWRFTPGARLHAELLADDLHFGTARPAPNRLAFQLGLEGAGIFRGARLVWGGEYTHVNRFVYTSAFGRDFAAQGRSLGFPFAPDARRLRLRAGWDLTPDWSLFTAATRTQQGENSLAEPWQPDSPPVRGSVLEGVVEESHELEGGLRWWPSAAVDLTGILAVRRIVNVGHVPGARDRELRASFAFRLLR